MSTPIDVLAVMDRCIDFAREDYEEGIPCAAKWLVDVAEARAAIFALIGAAKEANEYVCNYADLVDDDDHPAHRAYSSLREAINRATPT